MSTTRPSSAGDCGPEPEGPATVAWSGAGSAGAGAFTGSPTGSPVPSGGAAASERSGAQGSTAQADQGAAERIGRETQDGTRDRAAGRNGGPAGAVSGDGGAAQRDSSASPVRSDDGRTAAQQAGTSVAADRGKGRPMRQVRRLRLVGVSGAVPRARDFVRQALQDWGWLPAATGDQRAAAEDVLLVVSELVTNACLHADGPEELRVGSGPEVLRLEVVDQGSGSPAPRTPHRAGRPGGHGMFIVQRLCLDWGVVRNPEGLGKTVWAELAAPS